MNWTAHPGKHDAAVARAIRGSKMNTRVVVLASAVMLIAATLASCAAARPQDPAAVVQTAYTRLNKGDVDGFMALYSENAVLTDPHGRYAGSQAIRQYAGELVSQQFRFELSELAAKGNVVTYTTRLYMPIFGDKPADTLKGLTVVADGLIIFDGTPALYRVECLKDPSQVFCTAK